MSDTAPQSSESDSPEQHRPLVRQLDRSMASVYGYGGMGVLVFASIPVATAYTQGWLTNPGTWVVAITFALIGLYPLRGIVKRRKAQLVERFDSYCELNELDAGSIRAHFAGDGGYPYFVSLFESQTATSTDQS